MVILAQVRGAPQCLGGHTPKGPGLLSGACCASGSQALLGQEGVWQFKPRYTGVYLLPLVNCDCIFGAESLTTVPAASSFGANFGAPTQSNLVFLGIFQGLVFSWGRMPPPRPQFSNCSNGLWGYLREGPSPRLLWELQVWGTRETLVCGMGNSSPYSQISYL